jgi:hypothetical protein
LVVHKIFCTAVSANEIKENRGLIVCMCKIKVLYFGLLSILDFAERLFGVNNEQPFHHDSEKPMKYLCLGYMEEKKWEAMSESGRNAFVDECFAYDDELRKKGHFVGGEALQSAQNAITLRWRNGKVTVTDGPFAEMQEQSKKRK